MNLETKSLEFKAEISEDGTFSGYCSVFDNTDSYGEVVKKGAFLTSLNVWQSKNKMPPILWQHSRSDVIGVWTKLYEDEKGLYGEGKLLIHDVAKAREAYALIKNGAIDGLSIGYYTKKWAFNEDDDVLELLELDLKEVSIVTFPANADSTVDNVKAERKKQLKQASLEDVKQALEILNNIQI